MRQGDGLKLLAATDAARLRNQDGPALIIAKSFEDF
jgi:hypothetical protein